MRDSPYIAAEDSELLRSVIASYSGSSCLEIGAGNGGGLLELANRFSLAVGTDLVLPRVSDWSGKGAEFVLTDVASCLRDRSFDLVAFNPPYLATDSVEDRATDGGSDAMKKLVKPLRHGQITIPKEFREALALGDEDLLSISLVDGKLEVEPVRVEPKA